MIKVTDKQFWMDGYLKKNLDILKHEVRFNDWDNVLLIDGMEGSGKTVAGATIAYYLGYDEKKNISNFDINNIFWTSEQLEEIITKAKPNSAILGDEFVLVGLSTEAMTRIFNTILKYFTTIRKKNLHIIIIVPYLFMLATYFAVARSRALIHIITTEGFKRGHFRFYNYAQKRYLYFEGKKKYWGYPKKCNWSFQGEQRVKSLDELGINKEEYEKKKDDAISAIMEKKGKKDDKYKVNFFRIIEFLHKKEKIEWKLIPKVANLSMSALAIQRGYSRYKERVMEEECDAAEKKRIKFEMPS